MGEQRDPLYADILNRLTEIVGGRGNLCAQLGVRLEDCEPWLRGHTTPPREVFERALDLLLDHVSRKLPPYK